MRDPAESGALLYACAAWGVGSLLMRGLKKQRAQKAAGK